MRGIVRRHRLQPGDRFVLESKLQTIVNGRLTRLESLSEPIVEVHDDGKRVILADGATIVGDQAAYIERASVTPFVPEQLNRRNEGKEFEL